MISLLVEIISLPEFLHFTFGEDKYSGKPTVWGSLSSEFTPQVSHASRNRGMGICPQRFFFFGFRVLRSAPKGVKFCGARQGISEI